MFSEDLELLEFQDDEKRIIYSVAMRPNMLIPRKNINGEPAMVFYTEETVNDLQQNFFKNGSNLGATVNHDKNIRNDIYAFESWIVTDPEKDKATSLGLQVQKGDWVLGQKVDNPEVWQKIKNKELLGFSIEAYLEPVLTQNDIKMTLEEIDARIKAVVLMTAEEDAAKKKEEEELAMATDPTPAPAEPVFAEPTTEELTAKVEELTAENNDLKAQIAELEDKSVNMSAELVASKKVAFDFSEELKKGLAPTPQVAKSYSEMTNFEKLQYNRNK